MLTYFLGPLPWSLVTADGSYVKAVKAKLLDSVEKDVEDPMVVSLPVDCVRVFDGMVIIQQLASISLTTFGEMFEYVLKHITSNSDKIIYFVTDQYFDESLKGSERKRRKNSESIRIQL